MRCEVCRAPTGAGESLCSRCADRLGRPTPTPTPIPVSDPPGLQTAPVGIGKIALGSSPGSDLPRATPLAHRSSLPLPSHVSEDITLPPGVVLEGKYRISKEIGRGAMGIVYLAEDITLRRNVAVKFLLPNLVLLGNCADRFRDEAVAMAAIRDQNVAQIYTYGELDNQPYFVMEHIDGNTAEWMVDEHNRRGEYIPVADALDIVWQMLGGLVEIHRSGTVHRDIKPANIVLTGSPPRAVILDFGLVRDVRMRNDTVAIAGTPAYIAPELVEQKTESYRSPLVDIYSAGSTAYELFTGTIPFMGENWYEILHKRVSEDPVKPSSRRPELPNELDEIILKAMSKDPSERYQSSEEFLRSLMLIDGGASAEESRMTSSPYARKSKQGAVKSWKPSQTVARSSSEPATRASESGNEKGTLLIVDSDSEFRGFVHGTAGVSVPGCRVHSAKDGDTALELLGTITPNVVMIDFAHPDARGAELAAAIQANPEYKSAEVIAVADSSEPFETEILEWLGVTNFFQKPIDVEALANVLRPLLLPAGD